MNINSIIEKILGNSIVGSKGNIELIEESRLLDLLKDGRHNGKQFHIGDHIKARFRAAKTGNHRFPVTHFLYTMVVYVAKLLIFAFYWVASFIKRVITGKKCDLSQSPRFNFIIFFSSCMLFVMLIVAVLVFFIKSVLFSPPDLQVNEYGAITMPQSCERESYMYLLNTARCWENSGIKVLEGDEVSITVSGSFFSDIDRMCAAALNNNVPNYNRTYVSFDRNWKETPDSTKDAELLMTNLNKSQNRKTNNRFGLLLVQVRYPSQSTPPYLDNIITQNESDTTLSALHFNVEESGYLHFAVNDEYITESWFNRIKYNSELRDSLKIYNFAKLPINVYNKLDSAIKHNSNQQDDSTLVLYNYKTGKEAFISKICFDIIKSDKKYQELIGWTKDDIDTLTAWGDWDEDLATMWYSDNVGDVLINVKINRAVHGNVFAPSILTKSYRRLEDFFLSPSFGENEIWILLKLLSLVALWFVLDWCLGYFNARCKKKHSKLIEEPNDT